MAPRPGSRATAQELLFPLLARVERIDRWRRGIRPIRSGGILGIEGGRHRGPEVVLLDGTRVRAGDRIGVIHLDNRVLASLPPEHWLSLGMRLAAGDLRVLAAQAARAGSDAPVAYRGTTLLASLARRAGWDVHPGRPTPWSRLTDWYLRTLLARWSRAGAARLDRGRHQLHAVDAWLSAGALQRQPGGTPQ